MIWKFPLHAKDEETVTMPEGARVLCVQLQHGTPCIWADRCSEHNSTAERRFYTFGTGHPMPKDPGRYIGTYQTAVNFVFHVYEAP